MIHQMVKVASQEYKCIKCDRHIGISSRGIEIISPGDQMVQHSYFDTIEANDLELKFTDVQVYDFDTSVWLDTLEDLFDE